MSQSLPRRPQSSCHWRPRSKMEKYKIKPAWNNIPKPWGRPKQRYIFSSYKPNIDGAIYQHNFVRTCLQLMQLKILRTEKNLNTTAIWLLWPLNKSTCEQWALYLMLKKYFVWIAYCCVRNCTKRGANKSDLKPREALTQYPQTGMLTYKCSRPCGRALLLDPFRYSSPVSQMKNSLVGGI